MGMSIVYVPTSGAPVDGERIGSARGWLDWSDWAAEMGDRFPEADYLAEHGELWPAEKLVELEHELDGLLHEPDATPDRRAVAGRLLELLRDRPDGTIGIIATDGEAGGDGTDDTESPNED